MDANYTSINKDDRRAVMWLQMVLGELAGGIARISEVGVYGPMTEKNIRIFQQDRGLPMTGEPDEATMQKINQELEERGITL